MRVRLQCGLRRGEVVDLLPDSAKAMLADGRATPVSDDIEVAPPVLAATTVDRMAEVGHGDPVSRPTQARRRRR